MKSFFGKNLKKYKINGSKERDFFWQKILNTRRKKQSGTCPILLVNKNINPDR